MLTFCKNKQLERFCDFRETNRSITCEVACVKGVRRGRGRELGRETTREGGGTRGTRPRAPKFPLPLLTPAMQATLKGFLNNTKYHYHYGSPSLHCLRDSLSWVLKSFFTMIFIGKANLRAIRCLFIESLVEIHQDTLDWFGTFSAICLLWQKVSSK